MLSYLKGLFTNSPDKLRALEHRRSTATDMALPSCHSDDVTTTILYISEYIVRVTLTRAVHVT